MLDPRSHIFQHEVGMAAAFSGVQFHPVDIWNPSEIEAAVAGVRKVGDLPIVAQLTINDDGNSLEGVSPDIFGRRLDALDVDAIGVNCSVGPAAMLEAMGAGEIPPPMGPVDHVTVDMHLPMVMTSIESDEFDFEMGLGEMDLDMIDQQVIEVAA